MNEGYGLCLLFIAVIVYVKPYDFPSRCFKERLLSRIAWCSFIYTIARFSFNLYCDLYAREPEIDVILVNSELRDRLEPCGFEYGEPSALIKCQAANALIGFGTFNQNSMVNRYAAYFVRASCDVIGPECRVHTLMVDKFGFTAAALHNTELQKVTGHLGPANVMEFRKLTNGHSGTVLVGCDIGELNILCHGGQMPIQSRSVNPLEPRRA